VPKRPRTLILFSAIVLGASAASAQDDSRGLTECSQTSRDLSASVGEKAMTRSTRTTNGHETVTEVYLRGIHVGRLELIRRIRRVTTVTPDGSETVEETEDRSGTSPSAPMRVVRRGVTTLRKDGPDSYLREERVLELDVNGRFVPSCTQVDRIVP